jgi:ketosteroid isomerase-like protein
MSPNKKVVEKYFDSLSKGDRSAVLSLLTDTVERIEWADGFPNSGVPLKGKVAFSQNITDPPGGWPLPIKINRMTEESNVVVAECVVRVPMKDGNFVGIQALDIFDFEDAKIRRLSSFTAQIKNPTAA